MRERKNVMVPVEILQNRNLTTFDIGLFVYILANQNRLSKIEPRLLSQELKENKDTIRKGLVRLSANGYLTRESRLSGWSICSAIISPSVDQNLDEERPKFSQTSAKISPTVKEKETEEKRTKREDKEKEKDINNNIYISTDFSSQKGDTDKVKNEFIDTSVEKEDEKKVRRSKEYQEIIKYLNDKTGKRFTAKSRDTQGHISARLDEGFTVDDFKIVIDKKIKEWMGTDMEKYLRPETLFSKKFDRYLNESNIIRHEEKGWDHRIDVPDDPMLDEIWGITLEGKR